MLQGLSVGSPHPRDEVEGWVGLHMVLEWVANSKQLVKPIRSVFQIIVHSNGTR